MLNLNFNIEYNQWNTDNWDSGLLEELKFLFNISEEELEHCKNIVKEGIRDQILGGRDYLGNAVAPKKKGGRIFFDTGLMANFGVIDRKISAKEWDVTMIEERQKAAYYLNTGTRYMPSRMFWAVSQETIEIIQNYLINKRRN